MSALDQVGRWGGTQTVVPEGPELSWPCGSSEAGVDLQRLPIFGEGNRNFVLLRPPVTGRLLPPGEDTTLGEVPSLVEGNSW